MRIHNSPLSMPEVHPFHRLCYPWKPGIRGPSHLPEPQCAHVECAVVGGGVSGWEEDPIPVSCSYSLSPGR